jgi:hypothetical protein
LFASIVIRESLRRLTQITTAIAVMNDAPMEAIIVTLGLISQAFNIPAKLNPTSAGQIVTTSESIISFLQF